MATKTKPKLKIGLILDDTLDTPDGVQQYVLAVGSWLARRGHEVHYLVGETYRADIPHVHSLARNLHVKFNGNRMSNPLPVSRKKLQAFLRAEQFDILHVQVPYSPFFAHRVILSASSRTAIVGTFHIIIESRVASHMARVLSGLMRRSRSRFDAIVSVSHAAKLFAKRYFGMDSVVLPNVIDYQQFHRALPFPEYADKPVILYLGRLVPRKGAQVLLEAVRILKDEHGAVDFTVLICGKGPLKGSLETYAQEHELTNVLFTGFVTEEDKPRYYASATISVFPSSGGESFGIVLLEAMASGKSAVLAGNNAGYRSVLEASPDQLFDPKDSRALARRLHELLDNTELRASLAHRGEKFTEEFDINVVGKRLEATYYDALRKRNLT